MASTLTTTGSADHGKLAELLRRRLRAVPAAVTATALAAMIPLELKLWKR